MQSTRYLFSSACFFNDSLIAFLNWVITTGQTYSAGNFYVPLHPNVVAIDQRAINSITYTVNSTPTSRTINISDDSTLGWSPNSISVFANDTITLQLTSHDSLTHQFWIDFNNNGIVDANETQTESAVFSSPTIAVPFVIKPTIYSTVSFPSSGTFTFKDASNPAGPTGTFTVQQEQTSVVFTQPSTSLTTASRPVVDNSRVSVVGTMLTNARTGSISGNITVVAVDKTSGSVTFAKGYVVPNFLTQKFGLNVGVLPNPLSVDLQGGNSWILTRSLDINGDGQVNIVDLAFCAARFGSSIGGTNYDARADFNADGSVNIVDLVLVAGAFGGVVLN